MKRIRRLSVALIPALAIAVVAVWWWGQRGRDRDASPNTPDAALASPAAVTPAKAGTNAGAPQDASEVAQGGDTSGAAGSARVGAAQDALALATKRPAPPSLRFDTGPSPLSDQGQARIDAAVERLNNMDEDHRQYAVLASAEPPDPDWSLRLERLLQQAIDQHGRSLTGLEASRPRCTRTVCVMTAAARVQETDRPDSDWQKLTVRIMNEPWFREAFFDARTTVIGDKQGALYITYFIRK